MAAMAKMKNWFRSNTQIAPYPQQQIQQIAASELIQHQMEAIPWLNIKMKQYKTMTAADGKIGK